MNLCTIITCEIKMTKRMKICLISTFNSCESNILYFDLPKKGKLDCAKCP